jgi:hypothetical protein
VGAYGNLRQFWSRQLFIGIISAALTIAITQAAPGTIEGIPQTGFEALSGGLATLLGLTFTSFSILTTFMPNLRKDFVRSRTFSAMGATFVLTMAIQMAALSLTAVCFVLYRPSVLEVLSSAAAFLSLFSIGLMAELIGYMFNLFEIARRSASE